VGELKASACSSAANHPGPDPICWGTAARNIENTTPRNRKRRFMDLVKYLTFSMILLIPGIGGISSNRRNIIIMPMPIELMLLAVNSNFSVFPVYSDDMIGQLFALLVLTVAAAESAIGLAILVITFRIRGTVAVESINCMKG